MCDVRFSPSRCARRSRAPTFVIDIDDTVFLSSPRQPSLPVSIDIYPDKACAREESATPCDKQSRHTYKGGIPYGETASACSLPAYLAARVTQIKERGGRIWSGGAFVCLCRSREVVSSEHLFSANETHLENLVSQDASRFSLAPVPPPHPSPSSSPPAAAAIPVKLEFLNSGKTQRRERGCRDGMGAKCVLHS